jgi:hypothetical protein
VDNAWASLCTRYGVAYWAATPGSTAIQTGKLQKSRRTLEEMNGPQLPFFLKIT